MKINITQIVLDHLKTLRDAETDRIHVSEILLFFISPCAVGFIAYWNGINIAKEVHNLSVTFFGIFIALLLNMQVAMFGIYQRKQIPPTDPRLLQKFESTAEDRRVLLGEINANISYLILFCCLSLVIFFGFYAIPLENSVSSGASVLIYFHFLLSLLMIVKRSHALFTKEYVD
jgi:drug/metabolite transporter (DMT)-like permease